MKTFTRLQYLNNECTHDQFYGQLPLNWAKTRVSRYLKISKLKSSKESNFSDVYPLKHWDALAYYPPYEFSKALEETGDYMTLSGIVCALKVAARQLIKD